MKQRTEDLLFGLIAVLAGALAALVVTEGIVLFYGEGIG